MVSSDTLRPLPLQPEGTPWPTRAWPVGSLPDDVDAARFEHLVEHAFSNPDSLGKTHAFIAIKSSQIVFERYGEASHQDDTYPSWSMAKEK